SLPQNVVPNIANRTSRAIAKTPTTQAPRFQRPFVENRPDVMPIRFTGAWGASTMVAMAIHGDTGPARLRRSGQGAEAQPRPPGKRGKNFDVSRAVRHERETGLPHVDR